MNERSEVNCPLCVTALWQSLLRFHTPMLGAEEAKSNGELIGGRHGLLSSHARIFLQDY